MSRAGATLPLQHASKHDYRRRKRRLRPNVNSPAELAVRVHPLVKPLQCSQWLVRIEPMHYRTGPQLAISGGLFELRRFGGYAKSTPRRGTAADAPST